MQLKMMIAMSKKNLSEWLSFLEVAHPVEIELGLDRISRVAIELGFSSFRINTLAGLDSGKKKCTAINEHLKNEAKSLNVAKKIIIIGGTNGKGSCVAALESILRTAGHNVGTYTSPHLIQYNERIKINGKNADDLDICLAFEKIELARNAISLSYFEFSTLAALLIMADANLDFAILEIGLGGRLDAVNFINPDVSVITTIALDHEGWLGYDIDTIGAEKAAIAREGIPLIYGDKEPVSGVVKTAIAAGADLLINGIDFYYEQFQVPVVSSLPTVSVTCALKAAMLLSPELSEVQLKKGLQLAQLDGRYQEISLGGVSIILDVAHNPQASQLLAKRMAANVSSGRITAIAGMMLDKDIYGILKPMMPLVDVWHFCDIPNNARASSAHNIASICSDNQKGPRNKKSYSGQFKLDDDHILTEKQNEIFEQKSPEHAITKVIDGSAVGDTVVIFGSFVVVGPVLSWLRNSKLTGDSSS